VLLVIAYLTIYAFQLVTCDCEAYALPKSNTMYKVYCKLSIFEKIELCDKKMIFYIIKTRLFAFLFFVYFLCC